MQICKTSFFTWNWRGGQLFNISTLNKFSISMQSMSIIFTKFNFSRKFLCLKSNFPWYCSAAAVMNWIFSNKKTKARNRLGQNICWASLFALTCPNDSMSWRCFGSLMHKSDQVKSPLITQPELCTHRMGKTFYLLRKDYDALYLPIYLTGTMNITVPRKVVQPNYKKAKGLMVAEQ